MCHISKPPYISETSDKEGLQNEKCRIAEMHDYAGAVLKIIMFLRYEVAKRKHITIAFLAYVVFLVSHILETISRNCDSW